MVSAELQRECEAFMGPETKQQVEYMTTKLHIWRWILMLISLRVSFNAKRKLHLCHPDNLTSILPGSRPPNVSVEHYQNTTGSDSKLTTWETKKHKLRHWNLENFKNFIKLQTSIFLRSLEWYQNKLTQSTTKGSTVSTVSLYRHRQTRDSFVDWAALNCSWSVILCYFTVNTNGVLTAWNGEQAFLLSK